MYPALLGGEGGGGSARFRCSVGFLSLLAKARFCVEVPWCICFFDRASEDALTHSFVALANDKADA